MPVTPTVSPDVINYDASERQVIDETTEFAGILVVDWALFAGGLFLGFFVTLGSS